MLVTVLELLLERLLERLLDVDELVLTLEEVALVVLLDETAQEFTKP